MEVSIMDDIRKMIIWFLFWPIILLLYFFLWLFPLKETPRVYPAYEEDELADDIFTFHCFNQREYFDPVNGGIREREIPEEAPEFWF